MSRLRYHEFGQNMGNSLTQIDHEIYVVRAADLNQILVALTQKPPIVQDCRQPPHSPHPEDVYECRLCFQTLAVTVWMSFVLSSIPEISAY